MDALSFANFPPQVVVIIMVWDLFWRSLGLWYAIKNSQRNWFVAIFILNTVGILPLVYLKFYQKKTK
jgi:hypothetical protein